MATASSNNASHPTGNQVRRSYWPRKKRQVQFIPPEEVIKLVPGTRVQSYRRVVRWATALEMQRLNASFLSSSQERTLHPGLLAFGTNATSHSLGTNQTGNADQERIETPKPPLPKSKLKTASNRRGMSVDPHQKAGLGVGKKKGMADKDGPKKAKITHAAAEGCNP